MSIQVSTFCEINTSSWKYFMLQTFYVTAFMEPPSISMDMELDATVDESGIRHFHSPER